MDLGVQDINMCTNITMKLFALSTMSKLSIFRILRYMKHEIISLKTFVMMMKKVEFLDVVHHLLVKLRN